MTDQKKPVPREVTLTEVETCLLRLALRRLAETYPIIPEFRGAVSRREVYNLASRLDPYVKACITHGK